MKNPYTQPRMKKLRKKSVLRYMVALVIALPLFLIWIISRLFPRKLSAGLGKVFRGATSPFRHIVGFISAWFATRPWKKLVYALPLIAACIWIQSTVFMAGNRTDSEKFGDYRKRLLSAVSARNYEQADFLAGKLLMNGAFENDAITLYAAMIAAHQNGNAARRDLLMNRLTTNLKYAPAHMWYARVLLTTGRGDQERISRAIMHINEALKISERPDVIRMSLADVYKDIGRERQAIRVLEGIENPEPEASTRLAKLYMEIGERDKAGKVASDLLSQMSNDAAQDKESIAKRIELLKLLVGLPGSQADVGAGLLQLLNTIENRMSISPNDQTLLSLRAEGYMSLTTWQLKQTDVTERSKALIYMEKSIANGKLHSGLSKAVLNASNLRSGGRLTEAQIRNALVTGQGVSIAHILLGLDAWKKDLMEQAKFHFRLAKLHEPLALEVMRRVIVLIAEESKDAGITSAGLTFESNLSWRNAMKLLDELTALEEADFELNLLSKALILANKQRWNEMIDLLEPQRQSISEKYRSAILNLLYRASSSVGDQKKSDLYRRLIDELRQKAKK